MKRPFCVGLTGGVGSGKSTVAEIFAGLGVAVVDTDQISRELTAQGGKALPAIAEAFGADVIAADGSLDRARMRRIVFEEASARRRLEAILHPLIRQESLRRVQALEREPYVLLVVPLLIETGAYSGLVDRVLVVDCDEVLQLARTATRPGMDEASARAVMAAQLERLQRLAAADDVIENNGDLEALRRQVERLHRDYLDLVRNPY